MPSDRNKPCHCSSGKKTKKCCGRFSIKGPANAKPRNGQIRDIPITVNPQAAMGGLQYLTMLAAASHAAMRKQGVKKEE